jgi:hypothetical protein
MDSPFLALIHNATLLLAIAVIFDMARIRPLNAPSWLNNWSANHPPHTFTFKGVPGTLGFTRDITAKKEADKAAFELALEREHIRMLTSFITGAGSLFRVLLPAVSREETG